MAIDLPNSPSVGDSLPIGISPNIRFWKFSGSEKWDRLGSYQFVYDGKAPSNTPTATLDGGEL
jgi:hypothetical protein